MRLAFSELADRVAFCDPASGKSLALKRVRARSAIIVCAQDALRRIFVLHAWADRCSTDKLTTTIFKVNLDWRPKLFGIEANAMQSLYGDMVRREAKASNQPRLPLVPVEQPTRIDKDWRIRSILQPVIAEGRLFLRPDMYELKSEITTFPVNPIKDMVDALASAVALLPKRAVQRQRREESAARLAYLRETGAPDEYIEDVAAGRA